MFCRNDFDEFIQIESNRLQLPFASYRGLYYICYPQHAFRVPDGEESIRISRAPKAEGDNGLRFWIAAEQLECWREPSRLLDYLSGGYFEPIAEAPFNELAAEHCSGLIVPPELPLKSGSTFLGGLLMYSMKTEFFVSAIAEYEDEFIHFAWETAA